MGNRILVLLILLGIGWSQKGKVEEVPPFPVEQVIWVDVGSKAPAPVLDTNWIYAGSTANLTRKVAVGKYFKGPMDDTIRVVSVQSGGTRYLVIATDTTTTEFGTRKFRIETPIQFPSGATEMSIAVGDIDGNGRTDIITGDNANVGGQVWLRWFEWDPNTSAWVARDSIGVGSAQYINDIVIGNAYNDGTPAVVFNLATNVTSAFMVAKWNPMTSTLDTVRVSFTGRTQRYRGVAIGDVIPELHGNEVYVTGASDLAMAYWDGTTWQTAVITTQITSAWDLVIGDVDPTLPGNEIAVVHGSTSYQVSVWNYDPDAQTFYGRAWNVLGSAWGTSGNNDIDLGDFLVEMPGNELVLSNTGTAGTNYSFWLSIAPSGLAFVGLLPKITTAADYGVKIADVNRFRPGNELVISCGGNLVEVEQRLFNNDLAIIGVTRAFYLLKPGVYDTLRLEVVNTGQTPVSSFDVDIIFTNWPSGNQTINVPANLAPGGSGVFNVPVQMPTQLGIDTMLVVLAADDNPNNNTHKLYIEVWDDSTVAASSFSDPTFPPTGWTRQIITGTYNWARYTAGTNPTISPLDAPAMAGYPSYSATAGQQARLITHKFNVGATARKVKLRFYMSHDAGYATSYDSIYVEYSFDGVNFTTLTGFQRYDSSYTTAGWGLHEVEIGDFAGNTELYVALRARSGYGNNMYVDSVRVLVTEPTALANDAQILSVFVPKPVIAEDNNPVTVTFRNAGIDPITSLQLYYTLGDADTVFETWSGYLMAGGSVNYTFMTPFMPSDTGELTLYAGVKLVGDSNFDNDTTSTTLYVWPYAQTLPYAHDFDESWENSLNPPYGGWKIIDGGDEAVPAVNNNDWHRYVVSSPARTVARVHYSPVENHNDWLISPRLEIAGYGTYTLSFWHWYRDYTNERQDSGRVLISFDDGASWIELMRFSNVTDSGYKTIDLTPYILQQIEDAEYFRIAFHYGAYDEFWWEIDDFAVNFTPDNDPPFVNPIVLPRNTYSTGPDTVIIEVGDISPFYFQGYVVANDQIIAFYENNFEPGVDTIFIVIPAQPTGTVFDGYIYVVDDDGNSWSTQGAWWKLIAYNPGTPAIESVTEPEPGVKLTWTRPTQALVHDGGLSHYISDIYPGDRISVRFTPQYEPARIDSVVAMFYGISGPIHLQIFDDEYGIPGSIVFDTVVTVPVYPNYFRLDLRNRNIMVYGQYHIAFEWINTNQPSPVCDDGTNTYRSLYYNGSEDEWYVAGIDWIIRSTVTYYPWSKAYAGNFNPVNVKKTDKLVRSELPAGVAFKEEAELGVKYIAQYSILRSTTSGGPYDEIGATADVTYIDYTIEDNNTYYYVVRMDYVDPDTMTYSTEVSMFVDLSGPTFESFDYDSGAVGNMWVSIGISDIAGIYADTLYYFVNGTAMPGVTHDSVVGGVYYYTMTGLQVDDNVELYFIAYDNSPWRNVTRYPDAGYINIVVTNITERKPTAYMLNFKGMNVASKGLEIEYALPERSEVEIGVYSVTGQKVVTLAKGVKDAGFYTTRWDGARHGSGVYIIKMDTPKKSISKRVILTK